MPAGEVMPPGTMSVLFILSLIVSLISILVAFDARERGYSKRASILWFFAVQLFAPIALFYLYFARNNAPGNVVETPVEIDVKCPYCGVPCRANDRLCPKCGRIL